MSLTETFFSKPEDFAVEVESLRAALVFKDEKLRNYEQQISWLTEQLKSFKRGQFGSKSERWETQEQMLLINEAELESRNPDHQEDQESDTVEVKAHKKKRGHRKALPENLPREVVKIELPAAEQVSEDGTQLKVIGWEVSEKLKYEPAKMSVIQYQRAKYGVDSGDYVKTAPPVASVIPKGIATPELLSAIMTGKYADGLPLYRMEDIFARSDVSLSRGTMGRWMVQSAKALQPILNVLSDRLFESYAMACDETVMQVLKEDGRKAELKSWMIVRTNPVESKKVVLFDYRISRSGSTMKDLFAGYAGKLLCDGLESYSLLESVLDRFGCNMHSRRKFEQAAKDGAKPGQSLAGLVMDIYKKIYDFEEEIADTTPEQKAQSRQKSQRPLFDQIKSIVDSNKNKVPSKSKLGQAFTYFTNEYVYLTKYLKDGNMGPDNGLVERMIRKFAIGRNNWMFADTPEGADASSLLYSLVITAKVNGVNPYKALTQILTELPLAKTIDDYERLADLILTPQTPAIH